MDARTKEVAGRLLAEGRRQARRPVPQMRMRADQGRLHPAQTRRHESAAADVRKLRAGVRDMGDGMMLRALMEVRE
jgi:hypothetical protein